MHLELSYTLRQETAAHVGTGMGFTKMVDDLVARAGPEQIASHGLPYLPGSGVKGVVRQAARELASGEWGDTNSWDESYLHTIGKDAITLSPIDVLFGRETPSGESGHVRGGHCQENGLLDRSGSA